MAAGEVGQNQLSAFTTPQNDANADADEVRGNDEALREAFNTHDNDPTIHFLSGATGDRPAFGNAGTKFLDTTTGRIYLDTGVAWDEINYVLVGDSLLASLIIGATFGAGDYVFPAKVTVNGQGVSAQNDAGNSGAAKTIDWNDGNCQKLTLTGNCTLTLSNPVAGATYLLRISQDATGSRTITWPAAVHWSGGTAPVLTTTASRVDLIALYYDGTSYFGSQVGANYTA
jgi:hypothetical protein